MENLVKSLNKVVVALNAKNIKIAEATAQSIEFLKSENNEIAERKLEEIINALGKVERNESKKDEVVYIDISNDNWGNIVTYLTKDENGVGVTPEIEPAYIVAS
jgi:hypothetical protein